jgi:hypothetical protein
MNFMETTFLLSRIHQQIIWTNHCLVFRSLKVLIIILKPEPGSVQDKARVKGQDR